MVSEGCVQLDVSTKRLDLSFRVFDSGLVALSNVNYEELKDLEGRALELDALFHALMKRGINLAASHLSCRVEQTTSAKAPTSSRGF